MEILTFSITVAVIYGVLWFFDSFFKSCMHYPYDAFLRGTGLTIKLFRLQWYTTALNRTIVKWANHYPKFFTFSFDIGVCVAILLLPIAVILHFASVFLRTNVEEEKIDVGFEIMLPGVNLPVDEIGYYISALAICSFVHEMGHAFAAVLEDVPVTGFGFYLFLVFPLAYTEIGPDQLNALKLWNKLRVLCAGIWHNIALSLIAYLLFSVMNVIVMPLYSTNNAVIITHIKKDSSLLGTRGLMVDDVITNINNCEVTSLDSWYDCLLETIKQHPAYCITTDFVHNHDESVPVYHTNEGITECCDKKNTKNVCFEYMSEAFYSVLELPQFMCLNARNVIAHSIGYCHKTSICKDSFCIKPLINNSTTIIHIKRHLKVDVMYIGHPADITKTIKISEFVPKTRFINSRIPDGISTFLKYTVVFSFGLAVLNVIPCFAFDGQHIVSSITNHLLVSIVPERTKRDLIAFVITCFGSVCFLIAVVKVIWTSLLSIIYS